VLFVNAPEASMIPPNRVTKIFVCGDVLAFFLQAGGGGMMAEPTMSNAGQKTMLIGLFIQLLFFWILPCDLPGLLEADAVVFKIIHDPTARKTYLERPAEDAIYSRSHCHSEVCLSRY
jgi:hypothetical protein